MITDPVRKVESDSTHRMVLCNVVTNDDSLNGVFISWVSYSPAVVRLRMDGARLKVSSPNGERYAY